MPIRTTKVAPLGLVTGGRYGNVPLFVTENGVSIRNESSLVGPEALNDTFRVDYIKVGEEWNAIGCRRDYHCLTDEAHVPFRATSRRCGRRSILMGSTSRATSSGLC